MAMFVEMTCPGCGSPVRWAGEVADRPKCPKCGYRTPDQEVAEDAAEVERFREFLGKRKRKQLTEEDRQSMKGG
jgi:uncharacterized Zn finger protein (UPF0148 family)